MSVTIIVASINYTYPETIVSVTSGEKTKHFMSPKSTSYTVGGLTHLLINHRVLSLCLCSSKAALTQEEDVIPMPCISTEQKITSTQDVLHLGDSCVEQHKR